MVVYVTRQRAFDVSELIAPLATKDEGIHRPKKIAVLSFNRYLRI
jgi:hypothetical protein